METKVETDEEGTGYSKLLSGTYYLSYTLIWCFKPDSLITLDLLKVGSQDNLWVVRDAGRGKGRS